MEAAELYLSLEGPSGSVAGDAAGTGFSGQIDIENWSWDLKLSESWSKGEVQGGSGGTDRGEPGRLKLSKRLDRASTALMRGATQLTKFSKARITMLHRVHKSVKVTIALEDVRIESYQLSIDDGEKETTLKEDLVLGFETIRIEYKPRDTAGGSKGSATGAVRSFEMRGARS